MTQPAGPDEAPARLLAGWANRGPDNFTVSRRFFQTSFLMFTAGGRVVLERPERSFKAGTPAPGMSAGISFYSVVRW